MPSARGSGFALLDLFERALQLQPLFFQRFHALAVFAMFGHDLLALGAARRARPEPASRRTSRLAGPKSRAIAECASRMAREPSGRATRSGCVSLA